MARCRLTHSGEKTRRLREQDRGFAVGRHRSHGRYEEVELPIIGVGRIPTVEDAIQFLLAGAHAVQVGTAICRDPRILIQIISGLKTTS